MASQSTNDPGAGAPSLQPQATYQTKPIRHSVGCALRIRTTHLYRLSGCFNVLNTPELLEMIIRELDISTIMRLYRTSKGYRAFIESSLPIKKKLWLASDQAYGKANQTISTELNPFLYDVGTPLLPFSRPTLLVDPVKPLPPTDLRALMIVLQSSTRRMHVWTRVSQNGRRPLATQPMKEMERNAKYKDVEQYVSENRGILPGPEYEYKAYVSIVPVLGGGEERSFSNLRNAKRG